MNRLLICIALGTFVVAVLAFAVSPAGAAEAATSCAPEGELSFICGPKRPEDLVVLPGERWLIASGFAAGGGLHLIDTHNKMWQRWIAASGEVDPHFPGCTTAPAPDRFLAHGLFLAEGSKGHARLYVVAHGERETVEVFDVRTDRPQPTLTWRGCIRAPDTVEFNSVAVAADGAVLATVLALPGVSFSEAFEGKATGAVYEWHPGDAGFRQVDGTSLPTNNGIELSPDSRIVYVAASAAKTVTAFSRGKRWRKIWTVTLPNMLPDNLRWGPDGRLYAAGMTADEPACGGPIKVVDGKVDLVTCPRGYGIAAIDPMTGVVTQFQGGTVSGTGAATALPVGGKLWISSFLQDRVAYRPWP